MFVTVFCAVALLVLCCALTADWMERRSRRRDREIVRRIIRYMDAVPPARKPPAGVREVTLVDTAKTTRRAQ